MEIQESFLEPEVRDGFYIPSAVKQAWAAELEVLAEIDRICKKHNIPYFADWGTLLGAVRHGGFIPWDDDLDITMKRADYERFLQVAPKEMPDGFAVFTYENHPDFWHFLARFVAKNRICFEEEHLKKFHGFPYIVGIDIFVLDYVSVDEAREEDRDKLARYVIAAADKIADGGLVGAEADRVLDEIEQMFDTTLGSGADIYALRVQLYRIAEKLFAMFSEEESRELTRMMPDGLYGNRYLRLPKQYYEKQVWLPFENILLPVPSGYDEMLRKRYGDYMKLVRNCGGHDYPFFAAQKKQLQAVLDFEMPGYKYKGISPRDAARGREKSLKGIVTQQYQELEKYVQVLSENLNDVQREADAGIFQASQQLAIDMGTLIESCKGEGHPTVRILEAYCEAIFALSENHTKELLHQLEELLFRLGESIQKDIVERKEAVFLPYKASQWEYMQSVWQAAMEDEACDVYVIPIPYFYKEYDGALRDMQYEAEQFPENVKIVRYDAFDFELHYPEMIFIQNPYDEFDPVISVHTFFYSANLKDYTEQLIYIPPFVLEEFDKNSYREYYNMQYYCTMPGVVNADKVIVQSENMKQLYVEKLTEFAGEDTRQIWEEKILGLGSPKEDIGNSLQGDEAGLPEGWRSFMEKEDGSRKKVVLYYTGLSSFIQYREQMIAKVKEVFRVFSENREDIAVLWKPHPLIRTTLEQSEPELYQEYCLLGREFLENAVGILDETSDTEMAVAVCDAYYGDASPLAQMCRNAGKPVMMQKCGNG